MPKKTTEKTESSKGKRSNDEIQIITTTSSTRSGVSPDQQTVINVDELPDNFFANNRIGTAGRSNVNSRKRQSTTSNSNNLINFNICHQFGQHFKRQLSNLAKQVHSSVTTFRPLSNRETSTTIYTTPSSITTLSTYDPFHVQQQQQQLSSFHTLPQTNQSRINSFFQRSVSTGTYDCAQPISRNNIYITNTNTTIPQTTEVVRIDANGLPYTDFSLSNFSQNLSQKIIAELSSMKNEKATADSQHVCNICLENRKNVVVVPCGHTFCSDCTKSIFEQNLDCPYCKAKIVNVNKLFL